MSSSNFFGRLIKRIREDRSIAQNDLCYPFCSVSQLSKIESGLIFADYYLLSVLLERLGISLDRFELILDQREYDAIQEREKIEQEIGMRNFSKVKSLLKHYQKLTLVNSVAKNQYMQKIDAILLVEENKDYKNGIAALKNAILSSIKISCDQHFISSFLCLEEIRLLLILGVWYFESGQAGLAKEVFHGLIDYVNHQKIDTDIMVKFYPAIDYYMGRIFLQEKNFDQGNESCISGIHCLAKNGGKNWLKALLGLQIEIGEKSGKYSASIEDKRMKLKALEDVYEDFSDGAFSLCPLYRTNITHEIHIISNAIYDTRLARDLTQEEVSHDICSLSSLARIEAKKQQPSLKILFKISNKLDMKGIRFYTAIDSIELNLHEMRLELDKKLFAGQFEDARVIYIDLKKSLDTEHSILNRQYLMYIDTLLLYYDADLSGQEAIERFEKAYFLTAIEKNYMEKIYEPLTKQEAFILVQVAQIYKVKGDYETALKINNQILSVIRRNKIELKYFYPLVSFLQLQRAAILRECGRYEESKQLCKESMAFFINSERGSLLAKCLFEYAYTIKCEMNGKEEGGEEKERCKKYFLQALTLSKLYFDKNLTEVIKNHSNTYFVL